jgi:hypothetical protein
MSEQDESAEFGDHQWAEREILVWAKTYPSLNS